MLDKCFKNEHHEQEPTELEELERSDHSLDRPCIRDCKRCIIWAMCSDYRDSE